MARRAAIVLALSWCWAPAWADGPMAAAAPPDETWLVGLRTTAPGFSTLFDAPESPPGRQGSGYVTLVLSLKDGRPELTGTLPYLALPTAQGFLFLGAKGCASAEEEPKAKPKHHRADDDEAQDEGEPQEYVPPSSQVTTWKTPDQQAAEAWNRKPWPRCTGPRGRDRSEDIVYVTPQAICVLKAESEWTGGAAAFTGKESMQLSSLPAGAPVKVRFSRAEVLRFAQETLKSRGQEADLASLDIDQPYSIGWRGEVPWKPHGCLVHHRGQVYVSAVMELDGNASRTYAWTVPMRLAGPDLAPTNPPLPQALRPLVEQAAVVASPSGSLAVVLAKDGTHLLDGTTGKSFAESGVCGVLVMSEAARGEAAQRWRGLVTTRPTGAETKKP